ncbi:MAG: isoleucyl-tRNA synthetase [Candidatus Berkelbacteria bacterium]|nr:isoleucyl-tRNA synthetase [Candidatus Berkelbacteria bacterium]
MFKSIDPQQPLSELEIDILDFWQKNKIFQKSLDQRKDSPKFIFYDGPPFANGLPHYGHILAMTIKDTVTRFKTMEGFNVPRRGGWDTHGLPVEFEVEKELGISGKPEIEKYGVEKFNQKARESVMKYTHEWEKTIERMGRWIDWENAYTTMDSDYIESVWWAFKEIYNKGLVYQGYKSLPYCPRCGTPLSNFELNQGYKDNIDDPSVYIKFKIKNGDLKNSYLLAWTTTPWTLPGNMALAIGENIKYVKVRSKDEDLILAKDMLSVLEGDFEITDDISSRDLVGLEYEPLYDMKNFLPPSEKNKKIYKIFNASFVSTKDGTGIVHVAPAFGEDDLNLAQKENIAILSTVDPAGKIIAGLKIPGEGEFVKKADKNISEDLKNRNLMFKESTIRHTYPFCWRCDTVLIYYAMTTWFISVSKLRDELVKNNNEIHWVPEHVKEGRFGKWLAEARDWAISRNRYWGAPIPIWRCQNCNHKTVVGSIEELKKLRTFSKTDINEIDLHKPNIDNIEIMCSECGGIAKRIPEVLDCWFESGSMPYAQQHYPFENKDNFTRGWFYTLHVLATILFGKPAFKNCIVNGIVLAADGKKLSKRLKNYDEPQTIFDKIGVDALRYFLLSATPMGEDYRFSTDAVQITYRKVLLPLWNTLSFFITYSNVDTWQPTEGTRSDNILDKWIVSRLNEVISNIKNNMDKYDLTKASRQIEEFITDLSQWYLRRSRKREDKNNFYQTLYSVLKTVSIVIAPFLPFMAENIWQILKNESDSISVHLNDFPNKEEFDEDIIKNMAITRHFAEKGLSLRSNAGVRVRQPLGKFIIDKDLDIDYQDVLKDEINVSEISVGEEIALDTNITPELKKEGITRDIIRLIQDLRKKAGLKPGEKVGAYFETPDTGLKEIIEKFILKITKETNITHLNYGKSRSRAEGEYNIDAKSIWLGIK